METGMIASRADFSIREHFDDQMVEDVAALKNIDR